MCRGKWSTAAIATVLACELWLAPALVSAQEATGELSGLTTSQDGARLPGVTVKAEGTATGYRVIAASSTRGEFRFPALPPGRYTVSASREGFRDIRQAVVVTLGQTTRLSIVLEIGEFTDAIEVSATEVPLVNVGSTVVGVTFDVVEIDTRIPLEREVTQVALLAPGVVPGDEAFDERTPGQNVSSFSGASVAENLYVVNGLDITNFRNLLGSSRVPFNFVQEVQVKTGGYEAEFGRSTGGVVNMVTRSGTNTLRGDASIYLEPEDLQGRDPETVLRPSEYEENRSLEVNLAFGGPILSDRLFYFVAAQYRDVDRTYSYPGPPPLVLVDRESSANPYWGMKMDWNIGAGHRLEATYLTDYIEQDYLRWPYDRSGGGLGAPLGEGVHQRGGDNAILRYSGMLGDLALLSLQAGRNEFSRTDRSEGDECPLAADFRSGTPAVLGCWVNRTRGEADDIRNAFRGDLDLHLGSHAVRTGIDVERSESRDESGFSGGERIIYYLNGGRFPELPPTTELVNTTISDEGGNFEVRSDAVYVQDSWSIRDELTLNLGLRWERYENRNGLGEAFIETDDQYAPRVGFVWDPSGEGRVKVYGSYGVYFLPIASNTNKWLAGARYQVSTWSVLEGGINPEDGTPSGVGDELQRTVFFDGETPDPREILSENFEPMSQNEFIVGYDQALGETWAVGLRGIARMFNQVIEDFSIQHALQAVYGVNPGTFVYRLGNPGSSFDGWYDLDGDGALDDVFLPAEALGYPEAKREYYAVELTFQRRFRNNWMLQGSYVWSHLYGNYEGYVNSDIGQDDAGITQTFDTPGLLEHADGNLPNDRRHTLKVFGSYSWPMGLSIGSNFFYRTGRPVNSFGLHPSEPAARSYGPDAFYTDGEPRPRGCCGRTDDTWSLDLMFRYAFQLGMFEADLRMDVFNVFDNHAVTRVYETAETAVGEPDPHYGVVTGHQPPRTMRFGVGVRF